MEHERGSSRAVDCGGAGLGWLHHLAENPDQGRRSEAGSAVRLAPDWTAAVDAQIRATREVDLCHHAKALGVTVDSLRRLGAFTPRRWPWALAFPMRRTHGGQVVGIRVRAPSGRKWSAPSSVTALFVPSGTDSGRPLFLAEGPTCCAALLGQALDAIGRPNDRACARETAQIAAGRDAVLVVDRDAAGTRSLVSLLPGLRRTARSVAVLVPPPPHKDVRDWIRAGARPDDVQAAIARGQS